MQETTFADKIFRNIFFRSNEEASTVPKNIV